MKALPAKRRTAAALVLGALLPACLPDIEVEVDTRVMANGWIAREAVLRKRPKKPLNDREREINERPLIQDLAPGFGTGFPERVVGEREIRLAGVFRDARQVPSDFRRAVDAVGGEARNRLRLERRDVLVGTLYRFRERYTDAIEPERVDEALDALVDFCLGFVREAARLEFEPRYDTSGFDRFLDEQVRPLLRSLARDVLEESGRIDVADPLTGETGAERLWKKLRKGAAALGLSLPADPDDAQAIEAAWRRFLPRLLARTLARPDGARPDPREFLHLVRTEDLTEPIALAARRAADRKFGGTDAVESELKRRAAALFGTFSGPLAEGHWRFRYRLAMPGRLLRTNGWIGDGGTVFFAFEGKDLHPRGVEIEAESIVIDTSLVARFPEVRLPLDGERIVEIVRLLEDVPPERVARWRRLIEQAAERGGMQALRRGAPPLLARLLDRLEDR